jgi:hypothetical protein
LLIEQGEWQQAFRQRRFNAFSHVGQRARCILGMRWGFPACVLVACPSEHHQFAAPQTYGHLATCTSERDLRDVDIVEASHRTSNVNLQDLVVFDLVTIADIPQSDGAVSMRGVYDVAGLQTLHGASSINSTTQDWWPRLPGLCHAKPASAVHGRNSDLLDVWVNKRQRGMKLISRADEHS